MAGNDEADEREQEYNDPVNIRLTSSNELETKDYIDIYISNRNHIREQSKSVIPACGFLLTGALGLIYFIFSGNCDKILIHPLIIVILLFSSMALAVSIVASIISVQTSSSSEELPETRYQLQDVLLDIYRREYKWGKASIWLLGIASFLFLIIIAYFSLEYITYTPPINNASSTQHPTIIILSFPRLF